MGTQIIPNSGLLMNNLGGESFGDSLANNNFTLPAGTMSIDIQQNQLRIHDGVVKGGAIVGGTTKISTYAILGDSIDAGSISYSYYGGDECRIDISN